MNNKRSKNGNKNRNKERKKKRNKERTRKRHGKDMAKARKRQGKDTRGAGVVFSIPLAIVIVITPYPQHAGDASHLFPSTHLPVSAVRCAPATIAAIR